MKRTQHTNPVPGINTQKAIFLMDAEEIIRHEDSSDPPPLFDEIPPQLRTAYEDVGKLCALFCDEHPELPIRDGCLALLHVLVRRDTDPPPLSWGRHDIWAGGLVYATCQIIGIPRRGPGMSVSAAEIATFSHASGLTIRSKTRYIRREIRSVKQRSGKDNQIGDLKEFFSPDWAERISIWAGGEDTEQTANNETLPMIPPKSPGTCSICHEKVKGPLFDGHLDSCLQKLEWGEPDEPGLLIRVMDAYKRRFWLTVLAGPKTTLSDLDRLIKDVWVSCCGHLSAFSIGNISFNSDGEGEGMDVYVKDVMYPGDTCKYRYDFGSSTILTVIALRRVKISPPGDGLVLLGQNCKLHRKCSVCGTEATTYYQKQWDEKPSFLCDSCSESSPLDSEWLYGIGNSPRNGICGCFHDEEDGVKWHPENATGKINAAKKHRCLNVRRYKREDLYRTSKYPLFM